MANPFKEAEKAKKKAPGSKVEHEPVVKEEKIETVETPVEPVAPVEPVVVVEQSEVKPEVKQEEKPEEKPEVKTENKPAGKKEKKAEIIEENTNVEPSEEESENGMSIDNVNTAEDVAIEAPFEDEASAVNGILNEGAENNEQE